jgi:sigma-B regulation protein RsbU (phosphoserine phosphatase)
MSEHDLEDLFENAPCGYAVLTVDGRIDKANKTLCDWLGRGPDELAGKRPHDLLSIPGRIFYETHIAPLLRMQGFFNEVALDLISASGDKVPVIANAVEHRDENGAARYVRMAFLKAADRRRYEHELLQARDVARRDLQSERDAAELREQFIAVLGHDLRNPLASISAGTRLLARESRNDAEARILVMMQATVFRMAGLIDNVLDFARGRLGGGIALDRQVHDLQPALHQVVEELRTATPDRMLEERYALHGPVSCDRTRICQLASNLVGNALTHGSAREPVRLEARTTCDAFELSVTNGGEPILPAAMEKLFQPFFRGQVRLSKQGLGLGLYIASEIAKAHHGVLDVSSTEIETRFTFRMPLRAG